MPDVLTITLIVQIAQLAVLLHQPGRSKEDTQGDREELAGLLTFLFDELAFLERCQTNVVKFREAMKLGVGLMRRSKRPRRARIRFDGVSKWFTIHIDDRIATDLDRRRREMKSLPAISDLRDTALGDALVTAATRYARMIDAVDKLRARFPQRFQELLVDRTPENYGDFLLEASELLGDVNDFIIEAREALIDVGALAAELLYEEK